MGRLDELVSKLNSVTDEVIDKGLLDIVKDNQAEALDFNTDQLFEGKDSQDQSLMGYRSKSYADFKLSLNPSGVTDLRLTGDFYRGFYAKADSFPVVFDSTDWKADMLREKYGDQIFGLDKDHLETFRQDIKPEVQALFRSLLQL